jgi:hypothetical protein
MSGWAGGPGAGRSENNRSGAEGSRPHRRWWVPQVPRLWAPGRAQTPARKSSQAPSLAEASPLSRPALSDSHGKTVPSTQHPHPRNEATRRASANLIRHSHAPPPENLPGAQPKAIGPTAGGSRPHRRWQVVVAEDYPPPAHNHPMLHDQRRSAPPFLTPDL